MDADDIARLGTVLLCGSAPLFVFYFFLFQRTIASLDEPARRGFRDGALPAWRRILALVPVTIAVFVDDLSIRSVAVLWVVAQLFFDTRDHHRRLLAAGFPSSFTSRLSRISILAGVAMLAFLSGISLRGGLLLMP